MENCLFCRIIKKEIPADIVYEDSDIVAFLDLHPVAPVHILVVPKKHISKLTELTVEDEAVIGKVYTVINKLAKEKQIDEKGFRVIVNCGEEGGQVIPHIHFHLLGGKKLGPKLAN